VHIVGPQTLVVLFADIDIGDRALAHGGSFGVARASSESRQHQRADHQQSGDKPQPGAEAAGRIAQKPIIQGLTADPIFPMALITASATALARRLSTDPAWSRKSP
jgi:hypothetical protein